MSRYDLVSIITCYQLETLWKLKLARGRLIRGWKGIRKNGGGRKWINVSLLLYDGKMWRDRGKHCPIEYSQFCSSRLARTSNDLFHDFSSMNELINKCFRRKPFSYRIVANNNIDRYTFNIEISIFWGVLSKRLLPIFKEECISNIVASTLSADSAGQT